MTEPPSGYGLPIRLCHRLVRVHEIPLRVLRYRRHASIPFEVGVPQLHELLRLAIPHVGALASVAREIVEELVALDREVLPDARTHRLLIAELHPPVEVAVDFLAEEIDAVEWIFRIRLHAGRGDERRGPVHPDREPVVLLARRQPRRPANDVGHADPA